MCCCINYLTTAFYKASTFLHTSLSYFLSSITVGLGIESSTFKMIIDILSIGLRSNKIELNKRGLPELFNEREGRRLDSVVNFSKVRCLNFHYARIVILRKLISMLLFFIVNHVTASWSIWKIFLRVLLHFIMHLYLFLVAFLLLHSPLKGNHLWFFTEYIG